MEFKYGKRKLLHADEVIAVGDIHGEDKKLENILDQVTPFLDNNPNCHIVFCGDLCNRGPNSARVFEILISLKDTYPNQAFFIMGNHEEMFITTLQGNSWWKEYTQNTWASMVKSWGVPIFTTEELIKECKDRGVFGFIENLIPYYENDMFICTHAPLDKVTCYMHGLKTYEKEFLEGKNTTFFLERILHNIRWGFTSEDSKLSRIAEMKKYHICGHQFKQHKQPRLFKHRAFLDVGCGALSWKPLVAVKFPSKEIFKSFFK